MSITTTERTNIEKLLVLMFNAAPGSTYLSEVVSLYETLGHDMAALANTLDDIPIYNTLNPNFQTAEEFAAEFLTPLALETDPLALSFIIDKFNAGVPKGQIAYEALQALNGVDSSMAAQYVNAKAILDNKAAVSEYYSVTVGVAQLDVGVLQLVLDGITADTATVTNAEAEIDSGTRGTSGIEATLSPSQDTVTGTNSSDTVYGLFGDATVSNNTYTTGDSVDLGAGTDRLNLVALGTTASAVVTVKNVEIINIQDTVGATFNALLVTESPAINFTDTVSVAGVNNLSQVTNASLASVIGIAGGGDLTVTYGTTSGKADNALLSVNNAAGGSASATVLNVSNANTIEKVSIATTGTNALSVVGGTAAATLVITGDGTNTVDLTGAGAMSAIATIDASASTGTNTFTLGGTLNTGDTIKGGTGADTISTNFTLGTLIKPTMTGVETMKADFDGAAIVDLSATTGLTGITLSGSSENQTFTKADSSVATLTVTSQNTADTNNEVNFGYATGSEGALTVKLGNSAATAAAMTLADLDLTNTSALTLSTVGTKAIVVTGTIDLNGDQSAVSVTAGANLDFNGIRVDGGDVGSFTKTVAASVVSSGGLWTVGGDIGPVNVTVGANAENYMWVAASGAGSIGDVSITVTGDNAISDQVIAAVSDIGNITMNVTGDDFSGFIEAEASGGSIGDVNVSLVGDDSSLNMWVSAASFSGAANASTIGNINIAVNGTNTNFSGQFNVSGGDVGNVTFAMVGDENSAGLTVNAGYHYMTTDDYAYGGNIGNVSFSIDGDSSGYLNVSASGGSIGDITINADGGAQISFYISGNSVSYSGAPANGGDIGNVTFTIGANSNASGNITASGGDVGNVSVTVNGDHGSGSLELYASATSGGPDAGATPNDDYYHGGNVGNVTLDINGDDANFDLELSASGGSIGTVDVSVQGAGASGYVYLRSQAYLSGSPGGNIGAVTATLGDSTSFSFDASIDGTLDSINVVGGDDVSAGFSVSAGGGGAATDSAMLGDVNIALGDSSTLSFTVSGFSGSTSNFTFATGDNSDVEFNLQNFTGTAGATSITTGVNSDVTFSAGDISSIGGLTLTGGDSASTATVYVNNATVNDFGGVAATGWKGSLTVDLNVVAVGTTVQVGTGGSDVIGTAGSDNIFLGSGVDTVHFVAPGGAADVLFAFTAGSGKDVIDVAHITNFATNTHIINEADTIANDEAAKLTDLAGGENIATAAGLLAAINTGGEYALIDVAANSSSTFITASSAAANQFFVWEVVENTADTEADTVTLVGVVNTSTAFSALVAANLS